MPYPSMMRLGQHFAAPRVDDIPGTVRRQVAEVALNRRTRPGQSVAVTVGSRGIANLPLILQSLVAQLREAGLQPFLVPAMGSHGGGTAAGQRAIIEGYGVTEKAVGAPIHATMETVQVGQTEDGVPVYFDRYAWEADHVVVVGRIKPHTDFVGQIESGLHKMMLIGLGKHRGASLYHRAIVHYSFDRIIRSVARTVIDRCGVLMGLAIVENPADETALIEAVPPERFAEREKELLVLARQWMPRLPFETIDLLIVDRIGKDISGAGMDSNVVGRKHAWHAPGEKEVPRITRIYVRGLTEATHGNAAGLGQAEFTHRRLVEQLDRESTYINCLTGNAPQSAAIPLYYDTDRQVLDAALGTIGLVEPEAARVVRIHDTLHLAEVLVSQAYEPELARRDDLTVLEPARPMEFDASGDLLPF
ncbi:MAG: lactate racemase domain-containing protein [Candidatus Latescibacterota bacterium]